jgi:crotonobetainyl-CoA:carnitine CoA-transferase CaiB-like acyl-CoA transferase
MGNDGQFGKLCELIGASGLSSDPRFVTNPQRNAHRDALKQLLEAKLAQSEGEPLADRPVRAGAPCAPIHDVPAALADPHTRHRGTVVEIGEYRGVASPIKFVEDAGNLSGGTASAEQQGIACHALAGGVSKLRASDPLGQLKAP